MKNQLATHELFKIRVAKGLLDRHQWQRSQFPSICCSPQVSCDLKSR